jgi:hypothetical protein
LYDPGIIEYHQGVLGKIIRDMLKDTFAYFPVTVE